MEWPSLVVVDDIVTGVARHDVVDPPPSTSLLSVPIKYSNVQTLVCTLRTGASEDHRIGRDVSQEGKRENPTPVVSPVTEMTVTGTWTRNSWTCQVNNTLTIRRPFEATRHASDTNRDRPYILPLLSCWGFLTGSLSVDVPCHSLMRQKGSNMSSAMSLTFVRSPFRRGFLH